MNICLLRGLIMGQFRRGILGRWGGVCQGHRRMMVCFCLFVYLFIYLFVVVIVEKRREERRGGRRGGGREARG